MLWLAVPETQSRIGQTPLVQPLVMCSCWQSPKAVQGPHGRDRECTGLCQCEAPDQLWVPRAYRQTVYARPAPGAGRLTFSVLFTARRDGILVLGSLGVEAVSSGGIELMGLLGLVLDVPSLTRCLLSAVWPCLPVGLPYTRLLVRGGCARVLGSRASVTYGLVCAASHGCRTVGGTQSCSLFPMVLNLF